MTAMQKKQDFLLSAENSKPQTAIRKGRGQYLKSAVMCKAKSISKPTVNSLSRVISKPLIRDWYLNADMENNRNNLNEVLRRSTARFAGHRLGP